MHYLRPNDLVNGTVANNIGYQKLLKKTFKKMSKSVGAVSAAKFVQLENYFITMIQINITESIPFVLVEVPLELSLAYTYMSKGQSLNFLVF